MVKRQVMINTKTNEVRFVTKYTEDSLSNEWMIGWICWNDHLRELDTTPSLDQISEAIQGIFNRLDQLEMSQELHRQRLNMLEQKVHEINNHLASIHGKIMESDQEMERISDLMMRVLPKREPFLGTPASVQPPMPKRPVGRPKKGSKP
jgi:hypothetical protein